MKVRLLDPQNDFDPDAPEPGTADDLRPVYPRFDEFVATRDAVDPDRVFSNTYLETVLGR